MSCTGCRPVSGELPGGQSPHLGSIKWPSEAVAPSPKKENAPKTLLAGPSSRAPKLAGGPKVALLQYWGGVTMPVATRRDGAFAFPYIGAAAAQNRGQHRSMHRKMSFYRLVSRQSSGESELNFQVYELVEYR